ncbi:calcium-binding protein SPEC 1A-like [Bradysia coprophila]|uniref:calcium-binding protein SPEC 1A-like n=1 Tax=Bradysia coprophila TaxID=38358 RepID=UPI00187DA74A|nr:calcium-binding protein SPEC 1A-like [Bradysia coprophila]
MLSVASVVGKFNPPTVASQWKILSTISKKFSSSSGFSTEEIEKFRKVFRTMPTYNESISSKDLVHYFQSTNFIKPMETYQKYIEFSDKVLGGRIPLDQIVKYLQTEHDPSLLLKEYLISMDSDNDGYVSKEEFEFGMETVKMHDPTVRNISYEKFVKEADANKDGKISVSECEDWLKKNIVSVRC